MTRSKACDCWQYPRMHDSAGVCVNWEQHKNAPCDRFHTVSPTLAVSVTEFSLRERDGEDGVFARVEFEGDTYELSRFPKERHWWIDAKYSKGTIPLWVNGFGTRYVSPVPARGEIEVELDRMLNGMRALFAPRVGA